MKKMNLALVGLVAGSLLVGSVNSFAQTASGTPVSSDGTIVFEENDDTTPPKDPNKPDEEDENNTGGGTGQKGPLSLDVIPSFSFGTHKLDLAGGTYENLSTADKDNFLQVTDNRSDLNGWHVTAYRTEFAQGSAELTGSELKLPAGAVRNAVANSVQGNATGADVAITNGTVKSVAASIPVGSSSSATVFGAAATDEVGKSTSTVLLTEAADGNKNQKATLTVPAGKAKTGQFDSVITWTVTAGAMS